MLFLSHVYIFSSLLQKVTCGNVLLLLLPWCTWFSADNSKGQGEEKKVKNA